MDYEEYNILTIKNPTLDKQSLNFIIALFLLYEKKLLNKFIWEVRKDTFFIKRQKTQIKSIYDVVKNHCQLCNKKIAFNRKFCSNACKQKAYRIRIKNNKKWQERIKRLEKQYG